MKNLFSIVLHVRISNVSQTRLSHTCRAYHCAQYLAFGTLITTDFVGWLIFSVRVVQAGENIPVDHKSCYSINWLKLLDSTTDSNFKYCLWKFSLRLVIKNVFSLTFLAHGCMVLIKHLANNLRWYTIRMQLLPLCPKPSTWHQVSSVQ